LFDYKEERRDRAQWSSGNHQPRRNGANTRPETEL